MSHNESFSLEMLRDGTGARGPAVVAVRPAASLPGIRGGAGCPNLLQRPGSSRGARRESLVFRASSRGRSRPGAPLQQIRTRPRPEPPQEPHPHHHDDPGHEPAAPGEKGPFEQTITAALSLYVFNRP